MSEDLDPTLREIPYMIGGEEYVLREASGAAAVKYRNAMSRSIKLGPEGTPSGIDGAADAGPLLVSLCLFKPHANGVGGHAVPLITVLSWPDRVVQALFSKAKEISGFSDGKADPSKNLPSGSGDGSKSPSVSESLSPTVWKG